jgi:type I restriction enzyme M protein
MTPSQLAWISNYIWGIADDVLRDLYVRGKYRDVILPMTVIRRLDALLEETKPEVLKTDEWLDKKGITNKDQKLRQASEQAFYNTSKFTLRDLQARTSQQQLRSDFEAYLDGFSANVQEILENFEFRNQIPRLSKADALGTLIEKLLSPEINLSPEPVRNADGSVKLPGLDNHAMGTIFEELVRRFNEENNEEAGEHWTPRDAVKLMAKLIFLPIADDIQSSTYLLYDGACGTGGMLTVAEDTLQELAESHGKNVATHLYGQEINAETYAICKADLLLKGDGEAADNIIGGPEHSTLSADAFKTRKFDFMLSNPPYGKSWKTDLERMGGKAEMADPRFLIEHDGDSEFSLVTRSSDGQMLFLANMLSKMKDDTPLGSRIAEVHNGSSLFTGDAGQGESNIRRWIIENDWLEAIVALPLNMFYNTGIATYVWVLTNRKPKKRRRKVQLIDATKRFQPLRKNLGKKNCELSDDDIKRVCDVFLKFKETGESKIFPNKAFGYWKVTVERPLRLRAQLTKKAVQSLRFASGDEDLRSDLYDDIGEGLFEDFKKVKKQVEKTLAEWAKGDDDLPGRSITDAEKKRLLKAETWQRDAMLTEIAPKLVKLLGNERYDDYNAFCDDVDKALKIISAKLSGPDKKAVLSAVSWPDPEAPPVIKKVHKPGKAKPDPIRGLFEAEIDGKACVVEYEPDSELRDTEQVPLLEEGGVEAFLRREVLPFAEDAWWDDSKTKIGYEVSFNRYFYEPQPLRPLEEIRNDILALEKETEGLLDEILGGIKA